MKLFNILSGTCMCPANFFALKGKENMSSLVVNIKSINKCAFCKNWYDPTNSAIAPKSPAIGLWEIKDINQKCMCLKKNIKTPAGSFCSSCFISKI